MDKDKTSQGVKFTISSINWTMCREGRDDYNSSISRLIQDMKERGRRGGGGGGGGVNRQYSCPPPQFLVPLSLGLTV